jgi:hypothetical protein
MQKLIIIDPWRGMDEIVSYINDFLKDGWKVVNVIANKPSSGNQAGLWAVVIEKEN